MALRRWVCPGCNQGLHAPGRLRSDDVRLYCLPCSAKTGRLVKRGCPALERERALAVARRREREALAAARRREAEAAKVTVGGVNLLVEAARLWKVPALKAFGPKAPLPAIEIRRSTTRFHTSGVYYYRERRVVLTVGTDPAGAVEALLHELTHARVGREGHSARFWSILRCAASEAWPETDFRFQDLTTSRGWGVDEWIASGLRS